MDKKGIGNTWISIFIMLFLLSSLSSFTLKEIFWVAPIPIFITLLSPGINRLLSTRLFSFLGRVSYSFYLIHLIIISSFGAFLLTVIMDLTGLSVAQYITYGATLVLSLTVAFLLDRFVDLPGVQFANAFGKFCADPSRIGVARLWKK